MKTKLIAGRKEAESERSHVATLGQTIETLPGKQPNSNTHITRNGLNKI